jgi:hypothetical protein
MRFTLKSTLCVDKFDLKKRMKTDTVHVEAVGKELEPAMFMNVLLRYSPLGVFITADPPEAGLLVW